MKEKTKVKCHICQFETTSKGIGRHYKATHKLKLNDNPNIYLDYFEYNNPNVLSDIKNMIISGNGLKTIIKKHSFIGAGSLPILKKALSDVYPDNFMKLVTEKSRKTYKDKTGNLYSQKFLDKVGGFMDKNLAKKASLIGNNDIRNEKTKKRLKENNPSHNLISIEKRKVIYKNKTEEEKRKTVEKRLKTCRENGSYLKRAETIITKYGGFVCYGNKTGGHSSWHDKIKEIFKQNGIKTESEKTVVKNYTTDEVDFNNHVLIEFLGDYWHCNPNKYDINYYHKIIKQTAGEIWEKDKKRFDDYVKSGWNVFLIWESDNIEEKIKKYKELYG